MEYPLKQSFLENNNLVTKDEVTELVGDNINSLLVSKANTGALHFNGSGYAQCSKLLRNQQFSFAVRIKANKNDVLTGKQVNIIDTGVFYLYIHSSVQRLSVYATGNSLKSVTVEQNDRIFDGNWHSLFVTYDGTTLTLLDEFGVLLTADYSIQEQTSDTKIGTNFVGEMSNVYLFNFDMSSEDALYTIEDYQQGKPIPPKALEYLNQNVAELPIDTTIRTGLSSTQPNTISYWDRNAAISVNGDAITWTAKDTTTGYPRAIVYKFSKSLYGNGELKVNIGNVSKTGTLEIMRISIVDNTGAVSWLSITGFGFDKGELSLSIPYTNGLSAIAIGTGSSWTAGDSFTIDYLKIEHNGTILALEDYTINGKVLDYSGNNNHATITGDVKGDNDTKVETFVNQSFLENNNLVTKDEVSELVGDSIGGYKESNDFDTTGRQDWVMTTGLVHILPVNNIGDENGLASPYNTKIVIGDLSYDTSYGGDRYICINALTPYEGGSYISLHAKNTYGWSTIQLLAESNREYYEPGTYTDKQMIELVSGGGDAERSYIKIDTNNLQVPIFNEDGSRTADFATIKVVRNSSGQLQLMLS